MILLGLLLVLVLIMMLLLSHLLGAGGADSSFLVNFSAFEELFVAHSI